MPDNNQNNDGYTTNNFQMDYLTQTRSTNDTPSSCNCKDYVIMEVEGTRLNLIVKSRVTVQGG